MNSTPIIIANGGNAAHLPSSSLEAFQSAYTAGADGIMLTVQITKDNQLVTYEHDDLSEQTDKAGRISELTLNEVMECDAGARFQIGKDLPWAKNTELHRMITLCTLKKLLMSLEDNVVYFIKPGLRGDNEDKRVVIAKMILELFSSFGRIQPVFVIDDMDFLSKFKNSIKEELKLALLIDKKCDLDRSLLSGIRFIFAYEDMLDSVKKLNIKNIKIGQVIDKNNRELKDVDYIICKDVSKLNEMVKKFVPVINENWTGKEFDTDLWVAGISSGHHIMLPLLDLKEYNEPVFCASANVNDGLHINVVKGDTYASAGVVSRFSLDDNFVVDVDFTYDNPAIANMMSLAVINQEVWPAYYHLPGVQKNPSAMRQNNAFDTHGAAPLVSVEREEADGFRIMKYTSVASLYEWYGNYYLNDVGNGNSKMGRLRLERRGRFFTGYYQDENNDDWVGVGTVENASLNNRVYLRLAAKHYPKTNRPNNLDSLNVVFNNLVIRRKEGPIYQLSVSNNPTEI